MRFSVSVKLVFHVCHRFCGYFYHILNVLFSSIMNYSSVYVGDSLTICKPNSCLSVKSINLAHTYRLDYCFCLILYGCWIFQVSINSLGVYTVNSNCTDPNFHEITALQKNKHIIYIFHEENVLSLLRPESLVTSRTLRKVSTKSYKFLEKSFSFLWPG